MPDSPDLLKIRLGEKFEATASGRFAIVATLVGIAAALVGAYFAIW